MKKAMFTDYLGVGRTDGGKGGGGGMCSLLKRPRVGKKKRNHLIKKSFKK